jgi:outer membrane receptor for ferrienterochelin and colicins
MVAESVDSTRDHAGASFWHRPSAQLDYRLTASFVHTARDSYYGSGMDPNAYGFSDNPLWVLDGQVNRYGRSRILSAGVQWTSDHLEDAQPAYERFTDDTYRNLGAYVQDDWAIARGVQLLYGVRADKHSALDRVVFSPRVALRLTPRPEWGLRASVARGFRAPQVFDEDLHITQVGGEGQVIRNAPGPARGVLDERRPLRRVDAEPAQRQRPRRGEPLPHPHLTTSSTSRRPRTPISPAPSSSG